MSWFKGLFGGKSDGSQSVVPLTDREYEQLFLQVLQGVAASWDDQRLLELLGDRCGDRQMVVWLRGYGDRLLSQPANPNLAGLLVRLGEMGFGELGVVAQGIGLEMGNISVNRVESVVESSQVSEMQDSEAEMLYQRGLAELQTNRYQEALDYFDQAIALKLNNFDVWSNRGIALQNLSRFDEAILSNQTAIYLIGGSNLQHISPKFTTAQSKSILTSITIKPDDDSMERFKLDEYYWIEHGRLLFQLGKHQEALLAYERAIDIDPNYYETWNKKGLVLAYLGKYEETLISFERSINLNPNNDTAWYGKGLTLENLGRYEEALTSYSHIISFNSDSDGAWGNKGLCLNYLGRYEEAIESYNCAIKINPDNNRVWNNKGLALAHLERHEEAISSFGSAISIHTDDKIFYNRGLSQYRLGKYEEAIVSYDFAISIKPDKHEAWSDKGICLTYLGKCEEAIILFDTTLSISRGTYWKAWLGRGDAALLSNVKGKSLFLAIYGQPLPQDMQNPALDQRGYQGQLACYHEGLKYISQNDEPEGWGQLHRTIGNAHYSHGRRQKDRFSFWRKALTSYETALETLTATPKFETAHLETLQDLIRVLLALNEPAKAEGLLRKGTDFLTERIENKSGRNKELFEKQFKPRFNELTVGLYVQQGNLTEALEIAEKDKNAFLRDGLLANTTEPSPTYPQMRDFLYQHPHTAIIYWHISDNALTTFLLLPNSPEIKTLPIEINTAQINDLKDWIASWQKDYNSYSGKAKKSELEATNEPKKLAKDKTHPWRVQMEDRLENLKTILRIADIEELLKESNCTQLLLIPHRDLHLFPLDSLFDRKYTISYLPSIQVGINLHKQSKPDHKHLLSIENPDSTIKLADGTEQSFPKLTAAEAESELIYQMYAKFSQPTRKHKAETTLEEVTAQLTAENPNPHTVFHFTGHGYYDFFNPLNSALALSQGDRLTLRKIGNLDLNNYQLACLSACETAIAGNQSITKEYIGIISAFMYSGVANVVSTLWTVESISSAILMVEFHRHYLAGETAAIALATAKNWLRNATIADLQDWYDKKIEQLPDMHSLKPLLRRQRNNGFKLSTMEPKPFNHPYYWAAFTISGL